MYIFRRFYLKRFLVPDALSSLPYDHITLQWRKLPGDNPHYIIVLINIMPLLKLTRYYTLNLNIYYLFMVIFLDIFCESIQCYIDQLFQHLKIKYFYCELFTTVLLGLYIIFWFSCLCYLIPILWMYFTNLPPEVRISTFIYAKISTLFLKQLQFIKMYLIIYVKSNARIVG